MRKQLSFTVLEAGSQGLAFARAADSVVVTSLADGPAGSGSVSALMGAAHPPAVRCELSARSQQRPWLAGPAVRAFWAGTA